MRKLLIIALLQLFIPAFSQTSENSYLAKEIKTEAFFESLELEMFIGKKSTFFLKQIPDGFLTKELLTAENNKGYAGMLRLMYPEQLFVDVYVNTFDYTNPFGISRHKNLKRFEKETVAAIRIYNGIACINGCD